MPLGSRCRTVLCLPVLGLLVGIAPAQTAPAIAPSVSTAADPSHDFDFEVGSWTVAHRQRKPGTDQWVTFAGTSNMRTVLGGEGNVEDNILSSPKGTYRGVAVRTFDQKTKTWGIWWVDTHNVHDFGGDPLVGTFTNGVGTFFGSFMQDGKTVRVRFLWKDITPTSARWEQAFSHDEGKTWETNWTMQFTRTA